jgi:hypothetical protein
MKPKFVITFAGVPGSCKTPIVNHLSPVFDLPVFNNDQLRFEIREDLMINSINIPKVLKQYNIRVKKIRNEILSSGKSIILDSSVDRKWPELKEELIEHEYTWFLISIDFSVKFMTELYVSTGRLRAVEELQAYDKQHQEFLLKYSQDVGLNLKDKDFINRAQICIDAIRQFVDTHN